MIHALHTTGPVQLPSLAAHHSRRMVYAVFVFSATAVSIGTITAVAYWSGHPFVVPSLGPTAFLVFNRSDSSVARPRNIVLGHLIGALAGYVALAAFGLLHAPSVLTGGLGPPRIGAAALSIALTSAAMILLRAEHGPAGATTLIVSLGFMTTPGALSMLMVGVVFLAALGVLIDRFVGLQLPYWSGKTSERPHPTNGRGDSTSGHRLGSLRLRRAHLPTAGTKSVIGVGNGHGPAAGAVHPRRVGRAEQCPSWIIGPGQGRHLLIGSQQCTVKIEQAHAAATYSLVEVAFDPARPSTLLHAHYDFSETYFVLEGEVEAEVGVEQGRAGPGSTISVPVGVPHLITARGHGPARCLCVTDRAHYSDLEFMP